MWTRLKQSLHMLRTSTGTGTTLQHTEKVSQFLVTVPALYDVVSVVLVGQNFVRHDDTLMT